MAFENLDSAFADLEALARQLPDQARQLQRLISLNILTGAVSNTPVDTGRLKGGWFTTVGKPSQSRNLRPRRLDKDGASTIGDGQRVILSVPIYDVLFIVNNVEYVLFIENGTDKIAPVGMLGNSIRRVLGSLQAQGFG